MTDWNKVAATLDFILGWHPNVQFNTKNVEKAISLCERVAKGELVERSEPKKRPTVDEALTTVRECWDADDNAEVVVLAQEVERLRKQPPQEPAPASKYEQAALDRDLIPIERRALARARSERLRSEGGAPHTPPNCAETVDSPLYQQLKDELQREREFGVKHWEEEHTKLQLANAKLAGLRIQHERYRELQRDWVKQSEAELERLRARVRELELVGLSPQTEPSPRQARQQPREVKPVRHLRVEVERFASAMEHQLANNDWKGGWQNDSAVALLSRLREETTELVRAVGGEGDVLKEAADVANFAMMIADVSGALVEVNE